jgi:hypothetical protein
LPSAACTAEAASASVAAPTRDHFTMSGLLG